MIRIAVFAIALIALVGCAATGASNKTPKMIYTDMGTQGLGGIRGEITDKETGEPMPFVTVRIMVGSETKYGTQSDFDGHFQLNNITPGQYDVQIEYIGYEHLRFENVIIKDGQMLEIEGAIQVQEMQIIELKPIIYLYPEITTEVDVDLIYDGEITHTYPKTDHQWTVVAEPDGTLTDANGREYYGLFWEGKPNTPIQPDCGTVVEKENLISYLETSLDQLGLNQREANEFIVFWLPVLEQNPYNLIYFADTDYTDHAELNIVPKPDNVIRVMMGYVPLQSPVEIQPQILPEKPSREGFTVVEWGGSRCTLPNM